MQREVLLKARSSGCQRQFSTMPMSKVEQKLDSLIIAVQVLTDRVDFIDMKLDLFDKRLAAAETRLNNKYQELKTVSDGKIEDLLSRIKVLEDNKTETDKDALMKESYSKRLNILIHGVDEDQDSPWETHQQTLEKFNNFLSEALKLDPKEISLADIHRLPQRPVIRQGSKVTRPIIVKLVQAFDKSRIMRELKRLKSYNEARKKNSKQTVYVTQHLPDAFLQQKKALLPKFKSAKLNKQNTYWKAEGGEYVLYVDDVKCCACDVE